MQHIHVELSQATPRARRASGVAEQSDHNENDLRQTHR